MIIPDLKFSFWFLDVLGFRHRENLGEVPEVTVLTPSSPQLLLTEGAYMVLYIIYTYTIYIYTYIYIHHIYIYTMYGVSKENPMAAHDCPIIYESEWLEDTLVLVS